FKLLLRITKYSHSTININVIQEGDACWRCRHKSVQRLQESLAKELISDTSAEESKACQYIGGLK
ncbi:MAG: hypothetical protein RPT25_10220, partial [Cycloclasticus sp.]